MIFNYPSGTIHHPSFLTCPINDPAKILFHIYPDPSPFPCLSTVPAINKFRHEMATTLRQSGGLVPAISRVSTKTGPPSFRYTHIYNHVQPHAHTHSFDTTRNTRTERSTVNQFYASEVFQLNDTRVPRGRVSRFSLAIFLSPILTRVVLSSFSYSHPVLPPLSSFFPLPFSFVSFCLVSPILVRSALFLSLFLFHVGHTTPAACRILYGSDIELNATHCPA